MADTRLVLHLAGVPQPLHIALDPAEAENVRQRLPELMGTGEAATITTADAGVFTVNFRHVATAHIETGRPSEGTAYGAASRSTGFG